MRKIMKIYGFGAAVLMILLAFMPLSMATWNPVCVCGDTDDGTDDDRNGRIGDKLFDGHDDDCDGDIEDVLGPVSVYDGVYHIDYWDE